MRAPSTSAAHGVRTTAAAGVAVEQIAASIRTSNARLQFPVTVEGAHAINGPAAMEGTRAGVSVTRQAGQEH